jgi:hypothetical protein
LLGCEIGSSRSFGKFLKIVRKPGVPGVGARFFDRAIGRVKGLDLTERRVIFWGITAAQAPLFSWILYFMEDLSWGRSKLSPWGPSFSFAEMQRSLTLPVMAYFSGLREVIFPLPLPLQNIVQIGSRWLGICTLKIFCE